MTDLLKDIYPDGWERPEWAKTARKFGWMTWGEYLAVEPDVETGPFTEKIYQDNAFFCLVAKTRTSE